MSDAEQDYRDAIDQVEYLSQRNAHLHALNAELVDALQKTNHHWPN